MRPRFSLRMFLIAFTVATVALYVTVVRPDKMADRFVVAAMQQNNEAVERLMSDEQSTVEWNHAVGREQSSKLDRVYAEVLPREWQDLWRAQRRIILRTARHSNQNSNFVDWTEDTDVVAAVRGLQIKTSPVGRPATIQLTFPISAPDLPTIINPGEGSRLEKGTVNG